MWQVFWVFLALGCTSFGGPMAHFGYYRQLLVVKKGWLNEQEFAELMALCNFLPGPSSSQMGMALGYRQAGYAGAIAAFVGFTLPSFLLMVSAALLWQQGQSFSWLAALVHGFKLLAVLVLLDAIRGMWANLCNTALSRAVALLTAVFLLLLPGLWTMMVLMLAAFVIGLLSSKSSGKSIGKAQAANNAVGASSDQQLSRPTYVLPIFALIFVMASLLPMLLPDTFALIWQSLFTAGALVFGGGHVVLPLIESSALVQQQLSTEQYLSAYALAQAVPGPMFSMAAFLGMQTAGIWGALLATLAIFLPGMLLLLALMPYWQRLKQIASLAAGIRLLSAATVGLLLATWYQPVLTSSLLAPPDMVLLILGGAVLWWWRWPLWSLVLTMAIGSWLLSLLPL